MTFSFSLYPKYPGVFCMPCSPSKATTTSDLSRGWAWPAGGKSPGASQAAGTRSSPSPTRRSPSVCRRRRRWSLPPRSRRGRTLSPPAPPATAWTPSTAHHRWPGEPPSPTYPTSPLTRHPVCEMWYLTAWTPTPTSWWKCRKDVSVKWAVFWLTRQSWILWLEVNKLCSLSSRFMINFELLTLEMISAYLKSRSLICPLTYLLHSNPSTVLCPYTY